MRRTITRNPRTVSPPWTVHEPNWSEIFKIVLVLVRSEIFEFFELDRPVLVHGSLVETLNYNLFIYLIIYLCIKYS